MLAGPHLVLWAVTFGAALSYRFLSSGPRLHNQQKLAVERLLASPDPRLEAGPDIYSDLAPDEFRVMVLGPGRNDETIRCRLVPCRHADDLPYEALSYAWGDQTPVAAIECNGQPTRVTANLFQALRSLRDPVHPRLIWIDALCINQDDMDERASQVKQMQRIFSQSARVLVWLGDRPDGAGRDGFDALARAYAAWRWDTYGILGLTSLLTDVLGFEPDADYVQPSDSGAEDAFRQGAAQLPEFWDWIGFRMRKPTLLEYFDDVGELQDVLARPWFTRLWVIQEVAHGRWVTLVCGGTTVDWGWLATVVNEFSQTGLLEDRFSEGAAAGAQAVIEMERARRRVGADTKQDLLRVLLATNGAQCSDLRDKIYGVLSLASDYSPDDDVARFEADYSVDVTEVFKRFATWSLQRGNLDVLSCVGRKEGATTAASRLPSWVPDWTNMDNLSPFVRHFEVLPRSDFERVRLEHIANRTWTVPRPVVTDHDGILLHGRVIDVVTAVGDPSPFKLSIRGPDLDNGDLAVKVNWLEQCATVLSTTRPISSANIVEVVDTICATITAGLSADGLPAPAWFSRAFPVYVGWLVSSDDPDLRRDLYDDSFPELEAAILAWSARRRFSVTRGGKTALLPRGARKGDVVVFFPDGRVPYVVRRAGWWWSGRYNIVGEAFVPGLLSGQGGLLDEYGRYSRGAAGKLGLAEWLTVDKFVIR